jgi:hypothetical protein
MTGTLTMEKFQEVRNMLRRGRRHAQISRELGLSMWTIARVANDPELQRDDLTEADLPEDDAPADFVSRALARCAGCGAMVYRWPCLACALEESPGMVDAEEEEEEVDELFELMEEAARS